MPILVEMVSKNGGRQACQSLPLQPGYDCVISANTTQWGAEGQVRKFN